MGRVTIKKGWAPVTLKYGWGRVEHAIEWARCGFSGAGLHWMAWVWSLWGRSTLNGMGVVSLGPVDIEWEWAPAGRVEM